MKYVATKNLRQIFAEGAPIDEALGTAVREALIQHRRAGNPVAEWRDGRIVWVNPEDIPLGEADRRQGDS